MAGDGNDLRVRNELVGDGSAAFSGTAIILGIQFELEAFKLTGIGDGDLGSLGNVLPKRGIIAGHGSAHADLNGLAGIDDGATACIGGAYVGGFAAAAAGSQKHAGDHDEGNNNV